MTTFVVVNRVGRIVFYSDVKEEADAELSKLKPTARIERFEYPELTEEQRKKFRKIDRPYFNLPGTQRSQALFAINGFGCCTDKELAENFGVGEDALFELERDGVLRHAFNNEGVRWWRMTEEAEKEYNE